MFRPLQKLIALLCSGLVAGGGFLSVGNRAWAANARDTITFYGELSSQSSDTPYTGNVDLSVRLYNQGTGGAQLWSECWDSAAISQGRVTLNLGASNNFAPTLGEFLQTNPNLFVGIQVCNPGTACGTGCDSEMTPRIALG